MIRVCPKRDAVCPHGMSCPYTIDRYECRPEPPPMTEPDLVKEAREWLSAGYGGPVQADLITRLADSLEASARPEGGEVERRQIWRKVQLMAGDGLNATGEGSPAWNALADIHSFAVGQQLGERTEPMNQSAPPPEPGGDEAADRDEIEFLIRDAMFPRDNAEEVREVTDRILALPSISKWRRGYEAEAPDVPSREEIARTIHGELFGGDADELIHHPAANSWDEPTEPRWTQWLECADTILSKFNAPYEAEAAVNREGDHGSE